MEKTTTQKKNNEFFNFVDLFSEVLTLLDDDPIEHLIILTYEFDEQQLLNLAGLRALEENKEITKSTLKLLSRIRPVVFFDAKNTKPLGRLPQFLELHPYKSKGFSCHHSKAYCVVTRETIRLAVGSFNLTFGGLFRNREVIESWCWRSTDSPDLHLLFEWIDFLKQHYLSKAHASSASALSDAFETIEKRVLNWRQAVAEPVSHFLFSGYGDQNGLESLVDHWTHWFPNQAPEQLFVVSPFFDETPANNSIAVELIRRFPSLSNTEIVTDESTFKNLSQSHFGPKANQKYVALRLIPELISEEEQQRIERQYAGKTKNLVISRPLHAKILVLSSQEGSGLAYLGSANFSTKAWLGANQEFGFISRVEDTKVLRDRVLSALSVAPENHFDQLPLSPPEKLSKADDESVENHSLFPDFIDYIVLEPFDKEGQLVFHVQGSGVSQLSKYEIRWADLKINFTDGRSQIISLNEFRNVLLGGRTIEFRPHADPTKSFWFPFLYAGELIAAREAIIHPSSLDWLLYYLNPNYEENDDDQESMSNFWSSSSTAQSKLSMEVNRTENCVVAMQQYLSLFSQIEKTFRDQQKKILKIEDEIARERAFRTQVLDPLTNLAAIIERESTKRPEDRLFKLGELRLFLTSMAETEALPNALLTFVSQSIARIDGGMALVQRTDPLSKEYFKFVRRRWGLNEKDLQ